MFRMLYLNDLLRVLDGDTPIAIVDVKKPIHESKIFDGFGDEAREVTFGEKMVVEVGIVDESLVVFVGEVSK